MQVPLLDLKAQYKAIRDEVRAAVDKVLEDQQLILGPEVKELEEKIARYSRAKHGIGVASGTDALLVSLMAIELKPGDEVITTPYTFFATAGAISRLGGIPKFVDIDPVTYNLDPAQIERAITQKTRAIIPVHLYGQCADMDPILEIAQRHGLFVIEDAAQAIGAEYKGRRAGSMGHFGCFSFFPSKNLGGLGDGGMIVTNDDALAEKVRVLRVHGSKPKYYHKIIGVNSRLATIQAAALIVKLKYLDGWTTGRQRNAALYNRLFQEAGLEDHVTLPVALAHNRHIYNQYVIRVPERDTCRQYLTEQGIGNEVYYPVPMHRQECYASLGYAQGSLPESERAAQETLALPIYPELSETQIGYVVEKIAAFVVTPRPT